MADKPQMVAVPSRVLIYRVAKLILLYTFLEVSAQSYGFSLLVQCWMLLMLLNTALYGFLTRLGYDGRSCVSDFCCLDLANINAEVQWMCFPCCSSVGLLSVARCCCCCVVVLLCYYLLGFRTHATADQFSCTSCSCTRMVWCGWWRNVIETGIGL